MRGYWKWVVVGVVVIGAVIGWQLLRGGYKADIQTICNGEKGAQVTVAADAPKVNAWISSHLSTPEANVFFSSLGTKRMGDRAKTLREAAKNQGIASCPLADAYVALQTEADYRADLMQLCNIGVEVTGLAFMDDSVRMKKVEAWAPKAKSPKMKELLQKLTTAAPADRPKMLRDAAAALAVYKCDLADVLGTEPKIPEEKNAIVTFSPPQLNGDITVLDLGKALQEKTPDLRACYVDALKKNTNLQGRLAVRIRVAPGGKVDKVEEEGVVFDKPLAACVNGVLQKLALPATKQPLVSISLPIEFTPKLTEDEGAEGDLQ